MRPERALLFSLFCALLLAGNPLHAQDPQFSQFFASPLTLNPALTGKFNGVVRVAGNYRNQWPSINNAFITSTVSVDAPILKSRLPETDTWGVGLMAMTDKTASGILASNFLSLSTAYHKSLDEDGLHQIGLGFQGTYANKRLDGTRLHFEDGLQLDGTWLPSSTEAINYQTVNVHYFDMNAGLLYNGSFNGSNNVYFGASVYHINRPKESFLGVDTVNVPTRLTLHAGGFIPVSNSQSSFYFSGLFSSQANAHDIVLGGAWAVNTNNDLDNATNFYAGAWVRVNNVTDAVIPYIGLDYGSFNLGLTYDVNVSSLKSASQSRGGIELSLIYIKKAPDGRKGIPCPRF